MIGYNKVYWKTISPDKATPQGECGITFQITFQLFYISE